MSRSTPSRNHPTHLATPEAIIFDLDGTLIDSETVVRDCWQESMRYFGLTLSDGLHQQLLGRRLKDVNQILFEHYGDDLPIDDIRARVKSQYDASVNDGAVTLKPGALNIEKVQFVNQF